MNAADPTRNGFRFCGPENVGNGTVAVVILGGGHDLADEIKALNPWAVYQQIEPEEYKRGAL